MSFAVHKHHKVPGTVYLVNILSMNTNTPFVMDLDLATCGDF